MRFSLKTLLVVIALLATSCTALFYPNPYLITGIITATLGVLMFGLAAAALSRGTPGAYWIGFSIFAGVYFLAAFYGDLQPNYRNEYTFRLITSQLMRPVDEWLDQVRPWRGMNVQFTNIEVTMPIGHAMLTVMLGLVGGGVGRWLYHRQDRPRAGDA